MKEEKKETTNISLNSSLFKPKKGMFYIYFEEYQRSKSSFPSNIVRPLFGNLSDLQRNYFLPNDPKEYTFIGFSKEEDLTQILNEVTKRSNVLYTNALNGIIYRFNNNENISNSNNDQNINDINSNKNVSINNNKDGKHMFHYSCDNDNSKTQTKNISNSNTTNTKIPSNIIPKNNSSNNKIPINDISNSNSSSNKISSNTISNNNSPNNKIPSNSIPNNNSSNNKIPINVISNSNSPNNKIPSSSIPNNNSSNNKIPSNTISNNNSPNNNFPSNTIPNNKSPNNKIPSNSIPNNNSSNNKIPINSIPNNNSSNNKIPINSIPNNNSSNNKIPINSIPNNNSSNNNFPSNSISDDNSPNNNFPSNSISDNNSPNNKISNNSIPNNNSPYDKISNNSNFIDYAQSNNEKIISSNNTKNPAIVSNKCDDNKTKGHKAIENQNINSKNAKNEINPLIVDLNNYERKEPLGHGTYGQVYVIEDKTTHKKYAAKIQLRNQKQQNNHDDFIQEIDFYTRFKFPFILNLIGYSLRNFEGNRKTTMILDYMPNGSLDQVLKNKKIKITKSQKYLILYGIVIGMKYLHDQDIVHRDLKPANILLDENFYPRISDFGLAIIYSDRNKIVKKQEKEKAGSCMYMAPEIFLDKDPYSFKVDVYAFSMIAYQLLTNNEPYFDKKYKSENQFKKYVIDGVRPDLSFIPDTEIQSFFKRCWSSEPTERPSFSEIYDIIVTLKFKSIFQVNEIDIIKLDYWYEDIMKPFQLEKCLNLSEDSSLLSSVPIDDLRKYAYRLYYGIGIPSNKCIALKCMVYTVTKADFDSIYQYTNILNEIDPNDIDIDILLEEAALLGHEKSMVAYAKRLLSNKNFNDDKKAAKYFKDAASKRNPEGMFYFGKMLQEGRGIKKDESRANEYFKKSAELGYKEGIYQYAFNMENGIGCKIDYEASKFYKIASFYGDIQSMINLGKMLNNGKLNYNIDQSIQYLKYASKHDNDQGIFEYARALMIKIINGEKEEMNKAIKLFTKSIEKGNPNACFSYSNILFLNAFFRFLDNYNTIKESSNYLLLTKDNQINQLHYNLLKSELFIQNETKIQEKDFELLLIKYGTLLLKNTIKNHELIIDCLFFYKTLKQQHSIIITQIIKQDIFNSLTKNNFQYFKYIIENINKEVYSPYSSKEISMIIEKTPQTYKKIQDIKVNMNESFVLESYCCFSFSESTIPKNILRELIIFFKKLPEFINIRSNVCNPEDPNDLFTYVKLKLFSPKMPANEFCINKLNEISTDLYNNQDVNKEDYIIFINSYIRISFIHMQFKPIMEQKGIPVAMGLYLGMPLKVDHLYFDENFLPKDLLDQLLEYLHTIKEINEIRRNAYNGRQIVTILLIEHESEKKIYRLVKNFLLPKDILFKTFEYPLQNTIVINEKMVFKDKKDFDSILYELESIGIKPINIERDKLYLYEEFYLRKLFQKFSFICFKNEIDKMRAVNHINSIVYKGKKNVLNYDLELHYASLNDKCFPKYVRDRVPQLFKHVKGLKDIQRYVYSIESPVDRTYVGFDSPKHLKKCYYKFTYMKNLIHFNIKNNNLFWRKNNYKYLMIESYFYDKYLDYQIKDKINKSSKDFQERCFELDEPYPKANKRTVPCIYFIIAFNDLFN